MTEAAKAARRAYKAEWRRNNPEKVKQQQERYWEKRAAQAAQDKPISCRGCSYSSNPDLFDGACTAGNCVKAQEVQDAPPAPDAEEKQENDL